MNTINKKKRIAMKSRLFKKRVLAKKLNKIMIYVQKRSLEERAYWLKVMHFYYECTDETGPDFEKIVDNDVVLVEKKQYLKTEKETNKTESEVVGSVLKKDDEGLLNSENQSKLKLTKDEAEHHTSKVKMEENEKGLMYNASTPDAQIADPTK